MYKDNRTHEIFLQNLDSCEHYSHGNSSFGKSAIFSWNILLKYSAWATVKWYFQSPVMPGKHGGKSEVISCARSEDSAYPLIHLYDITIKIDD